MEVAKSHITGIFLVSSIFLSGCSEDVARDIFGQRTPIEVSATVSSQEMSFTRAADALNTNAGFTLSSDNDLNKVAIDVDLTEYGYSISGSEEGSKTGLKLTPEAGFPYFPVGKTSVNVSARYPNNSKDTKDGYFTIQTDQTTDDAYLRSDLMTAVAPATRTQQTDGKWSVTEASLKFIHQMAKLKVKAKSQDEKILKIKKIVVNDVKPKVKLTATTEGYTVGDAEGTPVDVIVMDGSFTGEKESSVILPAQTFTGKFLTITADFANPYNGGKEETVELTYLFTGGGKKLEANKFYTMDIVVGIDNVVLYDKKKTDMSVDISVWETSDATHINIYPTVVHTSLRTEGRITVNGVVNGSVTKTYTGEMITLDKTELRVETKDAKGDWTKVEEEYYAVTYLNNVDVGTATFTVVGTGLNYSGTLDGSFTIVEKELNETEFDIDKIADITYDGNPHRPAVNIKWKDTGKKLYLDTDFSIHYGEAGKAVDNVNVSRNAENEVVNKTITITGENNYKGTIVKHYIIKPIAGSYSFADNTTSSSPIRRYVVTGTNSTYTNQLLSVSGDGKVTGGTCKSGNVKVSQDGVVTFSGTTNGTVEVTLNVTGTNYDYPPFTMHVNVKEGPLLPIMYVAPYNMGNNNANGNHAMAINNWTSNSSAWSWDEILSDGYWSQDILDNKYIDGNGVSYHIPTAGEWQGILLYDGTINFTTASTSEEKDDATVTFSSSNIKPGGKSQFLNKGNKTTYAIRFKGTNYCCAYRYDHMDTTNENLYLTGNSNGKTSLVIRVIYLGANTSETLSSISGWSDEKWNKEYDFMASLPICGHVTRAGNFGGESAYGMEQDGYYIVANKTNIRIVGISPSVTVSQIVQGSTTYDVNYGMSLRLFKDAY